MNKYLPNFAATPNRLAVSAIVATVGLSCVPATIQAEEINLRFGTYTREKPTTIIRSHRPVMNVLQESLSRRLGVPVKISIQVARNYQNGSKALIEGAVDFGRFGPASYVLTKNSAPNVSLLAADSVKGETQFYGVIAVLDGGPVATVSDLRGRRFAFGSKRSTIGRYLSQRYLVQHGIHARDLEKFDYLGRHDFVGTAVSSGRYDAGALKEGTFKKLVKKGHKLRALVRFPNVTHAWVARSGLDGNLREALSAALIAVSDKKALKALGRDGFLPVSESDYDQVRQAISQNDRFFFDPDSVTTTNAPVAGQ